METKNKLENLKRYKAMIMDKIDNHQCRDMPKYLLEAELERCQEEIKTLTKSLIKSE